MWAVESMALVMATAMVLALVTLAASTVLALLSVTLAASTDLALLSVVSVLAVLEVCTVLVPSVLVASTAGKGKKINTINQ